MERCVKYRTRVAYADEAIKRFKLDVIEDKDALAGASIDRVREEFWALIRGLELNGLLDDDYDDEEEDEEEDEDGNSFLVPPARNMACFAQNEADISMLAHLEFPDDPMEDWRVFYGKSLKLIDARWRRPSVSDTDYRGVWHCSILSLPYVYDSITDDS